MHRLLQWLLIVTLAVLVVLGPRWWTWTGSPGRCAVGYGPELIEVEPPPLRRAVAAAPTFRDAIAGRYELRPDRRFLLAIALSDCLLTGEPPGEISGAYDAGAWTLTHRGRDIGSLRSFPDFGDAMALISRRVGQLATQHAFQLSGGADPAELDSLRLLVDGLQPFQIARALERIDELWTEDEGQAELLQLATRGLVALTVATDDPLELTDPLAARAMATLALAQTVGGSRLAREEALLALKMGYSGHASTVVSSLPDRDPVRLFVLHDTLALRRLADAPEADALTRRLSTYGFGPALEDEYAEDEELSDVGGGLIDSPLVPRNFRLTVQVVEALLDDLGLQASDGARAFEQKVRERTARLRGPFLDADTYSSYLSAGFYSSLYEEALRHLRCGCLDDDRALELRLEGVSEGPGAELSRWYADIQAHDPERLEADLTELRIIGAEPLAETLDQLRPALSWVELPRQLRATQTLATRLDSRVDHQYLFASRAASRLLDPVTAERLYARVTELAGWMSPWSRAWLAAYRGDAQGLAGLLFDERAPLHARRYALELASERRALPDARIREGARVLIEAAPREWYVRSTFVDYLEAEGDIDDAIDVVADWFDSVEAPASPRSGAAGTAMARLLRARGDLDEAYRWVEPWVPGHSGAVGEAALIEARRGASREALRLATMAVDRHPGSVWTRSVWVEVLWLLDRPDEAADVVGEAYAQSVLHPVGWSRELARAFVDAFAGRPVEDAVAAFEAVVARSVSPPLLLEFVEEVQERGRVDLAFELGARFAPRESLQQVVWPLRAHAHLVELEGEARALEWYRQTAPSTDPEVASMLMFDEGRTELLWSAVPGPESPSSFAWLMRAAAFLRYGGDEGRREALLSHYTEPSADPYHRMGRFLMGLAEEEDVLSVATEPARIAEVAYYVALKAHVEGRVADAADWYQVVIDTGLLNLGEYRWALETLSEWAANQQSVSSLARAAAAAR